MSSWSLVGACPEPTDHQRLSLNCCSGCTPSSRARWPLTVTAPTSCGATAEMSARLGMAAMRATSVWDRDCCPTETPPAVMPP